MTDAHGYDTDLFAQCAETIAETAHWFSTMGWTPATSGNFSMRMGNTEHVAITVSGRDKGNLEHTDIMLVDMQQQPLDSDRRPSAESALHTQIYRRFANVNAVLHTHSRAQSVASRLFAGNGRIRLHGWELQKAISNHSSHDSTLDIPVFPNTQHMPELTAQVDAWLDADQPLYAYLIDGHGLYTWGRSMGEARRHLQALEFLLDCELELRKQAS